MGFCKRCGEIVTGSRCKCGGTAVAPSINFNQTAAERQSPDRWLRTYTKEKQNVASEGDKTTNLTRVRSIAPISTSKLPRPASIHISSRSLDSRISSHINSTIISRPSSPLKRESTIDESPSSPAADIIADPETSTLSKAYGSVLQPKESLTTFTCLICSSPFAPDATIYPDPSDPKTSTRFLCKSCFAGNGGTKGDCMSCGKPVLILKSEGGFIENAGRIWHRGCFRCDGCFKDIGNHPLVDLFGRPSCEDCFDTCLSRSARNSPSPRRFPNTPERNDKKSNPGGLKGTSREGSPAIEELHQRLGIKSRENSPSVDHSPLAGRSNREGSAVPKKLASPSLRRSVTDDPFRVSDGSPRGRYEKFRISQTKSPKSKSPSIPLSNQAIAEMERDYLRRSFKSSPSLRSSSPATSSSRDSVIPSTPDLTDFSDATTSSPPLTPLFGSPPGFISDPFLHVTPTKTPKTKGSAGNTPTAVNLSSPSTPCAKCAKPLFRTKSGGRFVTVPEESSKSQPPRSYHVECFRCAVCSKPFEETKNGQAVFVRSSNGCCHVTCATPERIIIKPLKSPGNLNTSLSSSPLKKSCEQPLKSAPSTTTTFPRFGSSSTCPGCRISVSPMERGVVPGPQGSRWHAVCLVCGGKGTSITTRRDPNVPGCGKRLDSAAKIDGEGGVWCRECMLLLPADPSSSMKQDPFVRPITPNHTGGLFGRFPAGAHKFDTIVPQSTGTTTIARQFTGMSAMSALTTQLTGGGLSPTRQLSNRSPSPTKQLRSYPRPKSVLGMRGKSVDEGRGMFLVRQLTGQGL